MWGKLSKHWFLWAIAGCLIVGYLAAEPLRPLRASTLFRDGIVFTVMLLMGLSLHPESIRRSFRRPFPAVAAILLNILWVPVLVLPFRWLLPDGLYGGLVVAALVPCTLASASVWTRKAGGDDSIAIVTTVVTNLACVLVVPLGMRLLLADSQTEISLPAQMQKLALIVVLPLVLAQFVRWLGAATWADRQKLQLSFVAQFGILVMVLLGAAAGTDFAQLQSSTATMHTPLAVPLVAIAAITIHLLALDSGVRVAKWVGGTRQEQIAVGISASQKTLMVGLQIAIDGGYSVLPMIIYHVGQLALDTIIAQRWKRSLVATESNAVQLDAANAESDESTTMRDF